MVLPSRELPVEAWLVRLDPSRHALEVLPASLASWSSRLPAPAKGIAPIVAETEHALAVVNASYFDAEGRPLGLLIRDGACLSQANREGWAWAALIDDRLVIRQAKAAVPAGVDEAVQAGPVLVAAGSDRPLTSSRRARRAFIGADASGRIVLGATNGPVTLAELAACLVAPEDAGGAGLVEALNLDGGSSAQLFIAGEEPPLKVAGVPVPVFLGVVAKGPPDAPGGLRPGSPAPDRQPGR